MASSCPMNSLESARGTLTDSVNYRITQKEPKKKNSIGDLKSVFGPDTMFQRPVKAVVMGRPATPALQLSIPQTSEKE